MNSNNTISVALHDGTFCAIKNADSDMINISEIAIADCSTYDVIQTCDSWATLATRYEMSLDDLLAFNSEADSGSSTCGRDIKIPVEIDISTPAACFAFTSATGTITDYFYTDPACSSEVKIPSSIGGVAVIAIGASAFEANNLTKLYIPSSITSIADYAFKNNNLTGGLTWNANIDSIGTYSFVNARPSSISFGSNVTKIPTNFMRASGLTFSTLVIPSTIITIGACAFEANSSITSLTVPSSVISVGNYAFKDTSLSGGLYWNANIDSVGGETFRGTSISSVTWGSNVTKIPAYMFYYASGGFTTLTIPDTITTIGACALEGKGLTSLTLGSSVETIGSYAFKGNLFTSITFPSSVASIGSWALNSNNMTSITMDSGSTVISNWLLLTNDVFRIAYYAGGAGTYTGTQTGTWTKL